MTGSKDTLTPDDRSLVEQIEKRWNEAKKQHDLHRPRFEHFYRLYRSYTAFKRDRISARSQADRDDVWRGALREFGEQMFIPYIFATIETTLPRMLAQNPGMVIKPRQPEFEDAADTNRILLEVQQGRIAYPLILQDVAKDGLIYGLGVEKCWYEKRTRSRITLEAATAPEKGKPQFVPGAPKSVVEFDGPMAQSVDPFDFLWDPLADSMDAARYVFQRAWRDEAYIRRMLDEEKWKLPEGITLDVLLSGSASNDRDAIWKERMKAAGLAGTNANQSSAGKLHEVWEYHDGQQVVTILDAWAPVQRGPNPYWHGCLPFHVYRPTRVTHEMVGIGEAEAIEELNEEMNELRTSRRDNARLALQRPFAYWDGMADPNDFEFGPGKFWPIEGNPRDLIFPIPLQDIPASAYQEAAELKQDMQYVSGIDDSSAGAGAEQMTATGTQLVQAAANVRIQNKVLRLEHEVVKPTAEQFIRINQQHIRENTKIAGPPVPGEEDKDWSWHNIGPEALAGEFELEIVGGSMAPENPVQNRDDAQAWMVMFGQSPVVDQAKLQAQAMKKAGLANVDSLIRPQEPQIPMHVLEQVRMALAQAADTPTPDGVGGPLEQVKHLLDPAVFDQLVQGAGMAPAPGEPAQGPAGDGQALPPQAVNGGDPAAQPAVPAPPQG